MSIFLHVDGDSFFASVEQALDLSCKGKPVVTGSERGIASSMSWEAKLLGIQRGTPIAKIRREYPQVVVTHSSYSLYYLFSKRMHSIALRYCSNVEEYSIDEFFIKLDTDDVVSAEGVGRAIQADIECELGVTVSVGVSDTKVRAKISSGINKPNGFFSFFSVNAGDVLRKIEIHKVWGIGPETSRILIQYGVRNAYDLTVQNSQWVKEVCGKSCFEIQQELSGQTAISFNGQYTRRSYRSSHTFSPTDSRKDIEKELSRVVEKVCYKLRRDRVKAYRVDVFLKTQTFLYSKGGVRTAHALSTPEALLSAVTSLFRNLWREGVVYRAVGVTCSNLVGSGGVEQIDLFEKKSRNVDMDALYRVIDTVNSRLTSARIVLCSSLGSNERERESQERELLFSLPSLGTVQ